MKPKHPLASKLVWLGIIEVVIAVLVFLQGDAWFGESFPAVVAALGTVAGVLTVIVRAMTTQPLGLKAQK